MPTRQKLLLLGSLYFSQGLPFGFFTQALPVLMRKQGWSLEAIGLSGLLAVPWALKFLWAPLVDRYGSARFGRRRSFILPLQLASAALLASLAAVRGGRGLAALGAAMLATNLFAATQDIATDALAVDLLDERERGLGNGLQVAGYRVGMILGGGAMLVVFDQVGWAPTFLAMGLTMLIATLPIFRFREPPSAPPPPAPARSMLGALLGRPGALGWFGLLAFYKTGESLATGMLRAFLVDLGLSLTDVGWMLGTIGFASGFAGALAGGYVAGRLGRKTALVGFGLLQTVSILLYAVAAVRPERPLIAAACAIEHFASSTGTAALFTLMMDACSPDSAATDYTVQASAVVIATGLGSVVSGVVAHALGYPAHFALGAAMSLGITMYVIARWDALERFARARVATTRARPEAAAPT